MKPPEPLDSPETATANNHSSGEADPANGADLAPGDELRGYRLLEALPAMHRELPIPLFRGEHLATGAPVLIAPLGQRSGAPPSPTDSDLDGFYHRSLSLAQVEVGVGGHAHRTAPKLIPLVASARGSRASPGFLCWRNEPGETLRHRLRRSYPDADTALRILYGVAQQLSAIHASGDFHGGLCPANLLVGEDGYGQLLAPGLARSTLLRDDSVDLAAVYRAPEQLPGGTGSIGPAADVFALGLLLFELVECERPFHASSLELLREQIEHQSPPALLSPRPALPTGLPELIERALEPDPIRRLRTAAQFLELLEVIVGVGEPIGNSPTISPARGAVSRETHSRAADPSADTGSPMAGCPDPPTHRIARLPIEDERRRQLVESTGLWRLWLLPSLLLLVLFVLAIWFWIER